MTMIEIAALGNGLFSSIPSIFAVAIMLPKLVVTSVFVTFGTTATTDQSNPVVAAAVVTRRRIVVVVVVVGHGNQVDVTDSCWQLRLQSYEPYQ